MRIELDIKVKIQLVFQTKTKKLFPDIYLQSWPLFLFTLFQFVGGGHTTFCGFLNCFVHVVMYSYYFLAALGPWIHPYLWWKRYLTKLQMIQFIIFILHAMQPLFMEECDYPKVCCWTILAHGILYLILFANFYIKSYQGTTSVLESRTQNNKME